MKETWQELLGCVLVYGIIALVIAAGALLIGQVPQLLIDHGMGLSMYLGHLLMPVVYYAFILACLFVMALGFTAAGVAARDIFQAGKTPMPDSVAGNR